MCWSHPDDVLIDMFLSVSISWPPHSACGNLLCCVCEIDVEFENLMNGTLLSLKLTNHTQRPGCHREAPSQKHRPPLLCVEEVIIRLHERLYNVQLTAVRRSLHQGLCYPRTSPPLHRAQTASNQKKPIWHHLKSAIYSYSRPKLSNIETNLADING